MASTSNNYTTTNTATMNNPPTYGSDPTSPNTTYVQAEPSTFRTIVQRLTGAPEDPSTQKLPLTLPTRPAQKPIPTTPDIGPKRPAFKLHERRQSAKKLEIKLNNNNNNNNNNNHYNYNSNSNNNISNVECHELCFVRQRGFLVSPVSTLEFFGRVSPTSPCEEYYARGSPISTPCVEEEKAIAEKGFYLHPSPINTPRGSEPPELLPLFPLHSPRDNNQRHSSSSSSS